MEIKITEDNVGNLNAGDVIKYHNGYEWCEKELTKSDVCNGYVMTGVHNETSKFTSPRFGDATYLVKMSVATNPLAEEMEIVETIAKALSDKGYHVSEFDGIPFLMDLDGNLNVSILEDLGNGLRKSFGITITNHKRP